MGTKPKQDGQELICEMCQGVKGIGSTTAGAISTHFAGKLADFLDASYDDFAEIFKENRRLRLNEIQIGEILKTTQVFAGIQDLRDAWILWIGRKFLNDVVSKIENLSLEDLDVNPFLAIVLELNDPAQIIEFQLNQNVTRSVVTSWGTVVEKLLIRSGAEKLISTAKDRPGRRPDIKKMKGGKEFHLQIKSGPSCMNRDMVGSLSEVIDAYKKSKSKANMRLGITYASRERVSSVIRSLPDFKDVSFVGRELWDFVSDEKDYHITIFDLLDKASQGILVEPLMELVTKKKRKLLSEWNAQHGKKSVMQVLNDYI